MSTPVQGGPAGPLGYAPRRAREAGTTGANTASPLQEMRDRRNALSLGEDRDPVTRDPLSPRDAPSLRDTLSSPDGLPPRSPMPSRELPPLRDTLSDLEGLSSRSPQPMPPPRETSAVRDALSALESLSSRPQSSREPPQMRAALSALESLSSRRESLLARNAVPSHDNGLPPTSRDPAPMRDLRQPRDVQPLRSPLLEQDRPSVRDSASLRDTLAFGEAPLLRDTALPPIKGEPGSGPRDLLDDAADLGLVPSREAISEWEPAPSRTAGAAAASGAETPWKRKKRSSPAAFEGDTALKELRSRLSTASADQAPEPPAAVATKAPAFTSTMRLMGVVGLAAGGALGFLWLTSPHGQRTANPQGNEYALVSLRGVEPPPKPANQTVPPESTPTSNAPWSVANYTGDAANRAVTPPVTPPPSTRSPPAASRTAPLPVAPPPIAVTTPPPADRDEIDAMLSRARNFLSSGDVAAARVVLRRAAELDDPQAALALGGTYDPAVLKKLGIMGYHHADAAQARDWYRKAAQLGSTDASQRLEQMAPTDH